MVGKGKMSLVTEICPNVLYSIISSRFTQLKMLWYEKKELYFTNRTFSLVLRKVTLMAMFISTEGQEFANSSTIKKNYRKGKKYWISCLVILSCSMFKTLMLNCRRSRR